MRLEWLLNRMKCCLVGFVYSGTMSRIDPILLPWGRLQGAYFGDSSDIYQRPCASHYQPRPPPGKERPLTIRSTNPEP